VALVVFCLVAVGIIGMSFCQGRGQAKIRREYIRHHRIILTLLLLMWLPPILANFLIRLDQTDSPLFDVANKLAFFFMVALTGVITLVRIAYDRFLREKVQHGGCRLGKCCVWGKGGNSNGQFRQSLKKITYNSL
jgi:hypothetical protein